MKCEHYDPGDLTVGIGAGCTVARLASMVAKDGLLFAAMSRCRSEPPSAECWPQESPVRCATATADCATTASEFAS